jgi:hypothetical protein
VSKKQVVRSSMDIRKRVVAPFAETSTTDGIMRVDLSGFVLRLLLFDKYICQSTRLKEFPYLIKAFGYEGVKALLDSKAIDIDCDIAGITQVGQMKVLEGRRKKGILPLGSYSFSTARFVLDRTKFIHECLQSFHKIEGLHKRDVIKLKGAVASRILPLPKQADEDTIEQLKCDMRLNVPNIKSAIAINFKWKFKTEINPADLSVQINPIDEEDFHTETNLTKDFHISEKEAHEVVEGGLLTVGSLNRRIAEMKAYTALSGFKDSDLPIFDQKLDFILRSFSPQSQEDRIKRVFVIKGFQDLDDLINRGQVDLVRLLEIRESKECKEFRDWLLSIDSASDAEIEERINSLKEKPSWFAHSSSGKSVRWLASTGIGLVGNVAGAIAGLLDTFLLDKLLPNPGPISFLTSMYPSIFKENPMITPENFLRTTQK